MNRPEWPPLIVSTATALCLVRNRRVEVVEQERALYFGITWHDATLFVACGFTEKDEQIVAFDHGLVCRRTWTIPARNTHQILWHGDKLYLTLTEANQVATFDPQTGQLATVYETGGAVLDGGIGEDHVNSLWFDKDGWPWTCEHRQSTRFHRPSRIRRLDPGFGVNRDYYVGTNAHNAYVENGTLFVCDSTGERLALVGLQDGSRRYVPVGGFARGFARTPDGYIVGVSPVAPRQRRADGNAQLVYIDAATLTVRDRITIYGLGAVQDLRNIDGDASHNNRSFAVEWVGA